mmetsp:Transcript_50208/g.120807  ORF Transcript_50208/g.120807 Transcript_50208/m.120807 type:complete len:279 (+) Transcript_50208:71-907(+)
MAMVGPAAPHLVHGRPLVDGLAHLLLAHLLLVRLLHRDVRVARVVAQDAAALGAVLVARLLRGRGAGGRHLMHGGARRGWFVITPPGLDDGRRRDRVALRPMLRAAHQPGGAQHLPRDGHALARLAVHVRVGVRAVVKAAVGAEHADGIAGVYRAACGLVLRPLAIAEARLEVLRVRVVDARGARVDTKGVLEGDAASEANLGDVLFDHPEDVRRLHARRRGVVAELLHLVPHLARVGLGASRVGRAVRVEVGDVVREREVAMRERWLRCAEQLLEHF